VGVSDEKVGGGKDAERWGGEQEKHIILAPEEAALFGEFFIPAEKGEGRGKHQNTERA